MFYLPRCKLTARILDMFISAQVDELKKHYLSKNLYLNFPTTTEYDNLKIALNDEIIDSQLSHKIDIGNLEILNLSKLHSANKFLDRRYQAYDRITGEKLANVGFRCLFSGNMAFSPKAISPRMKIMWTDECQSVLVSSHLPAHWNVTH